MTKADVEALPYRRCAGVVLVNSTGEVFAGQRIDNPGDAWQMPQGGIEEGEEPLDAALRELREETGVPSSAVQFLAEIADWIPYDLPPELVGKIWGGRYRGQTQKWFLFRFVGDDGVIDIATEHSEFSRWTWMRSDELIGKIVPFKREVYERVFGEFSGLL